MRSQAEFWAALNLGAAAVAAGLAWHIRRYRWRPGARAFVVMMLTVAWWCLSAAGELLAPGVAAKVCWGKLQYLAVPYAAPLWFVFALHLGRDTPKPRPRVLVALAVIPFVVMVLAFTNERHGLIWTAIRFSQSPAAFGQLVYDHGPAVWLDVAYAYSLLLAGTVLLLREALTSARVYRRQIAVLVLAALVPWFASVAYMLRWEPLGGMDPTALSFTTSGLIIALGVFRYRLLDLVPFAYHQVIANLSHGVLVVDRDGRLLDLNPAAAKLLDLSGPVVGRSCDALLSHWPDVAAACLADQPPGEVRDNRSDTPRWLELHSSALVATASGGAGRVVEVRDVTAQKQAEEDRFELHRRRQQAEHLQSLAALTGGIAHDFNNLLATILGNIDLALTCVTAEPATTRLLDRAKDASLRAASLVSQLAANAGQMQPAAQQVDLADVARCLTANPSAIVPAEVRLAADIEGEPPAVQGDLEQLEQVTVALLANAGEAYEGQAGEVRVAVRAVRLDREQPASPVHLAMLPPGDYVELAVHDQGRGMSAEVQARLFDPFFSTRFPGRGLGMAAVLGLVRGHEGGIDIDSAEGRGTTVRVLLPVADTTAADPPAG